MADVFCNIFRDTMSIRNILFIYLALLSKIAFTQDLAQVTFTGGSTISYFTLITDGDVLIRISPEGKIVEWGTEIQSYRNSFYYSPKLQPYMGRVEYYGLEADSISKGKIKTIGNCQFTYYGEYDDVAKRGKLRTAGRNVFDYYSSYDMKDVQGRLKILDARQIQYYSSIDDISFRNKIRSIGSTSITYYSSFDDKAIKGKVKSIGPISYSWYTSLDVNFGPGSLKYNNFRQNIGGITYIIQ